MNGVRMLAALGLAAGLAGCGTGEPAPPPVVQVWCYDTLADPECYLEPDGLRPASYIGAYALTVPGPIERHGISAAPAPSVALALPR
ncbi:hypothetical protein [Arenibaculum pallidiluteum]|uniref:hypothetical protein n=1 Tax=Arenibaculum pallidiluteum TaxID=2812559 RepID=UPI001A96AFAC|nr:hypothetical protein [Arenibaculum pallidiluteum]